MRQVGDTDMHEAGGSLDEGEDVADDALEDEECERRRKGQDRAGIDLSRQNLEAHFRFTRKEAALRLGISETTLKNACRRLGIDRWPYREIARRAKALQVPNAGDPVVPNQQPPATRPQADGSHKEAATMMPTCVYEEYVGCLVSDSLAGSGGTHWSFLLYTRIYHAFIHTDTMLSCGEDGRLRAYNERPARDIMKALRPFVGACDAVRAREPTFMHGEIPAQQDGTSCGLRSLDLDEHGAEAFRVMIRKEAVGQLLGAWPAWLDAQPDLLSELLREHDMADQGTASPKARTYKPPSLEFHGRLRPTTDQLEVYHSALEKRFDGGDPDEVLAGARNFDIKRHNLPTLLENRELDDNYVNIYMDRVQARDTARRGQPGADRWHFENSFLVAKLLLDGVSSRMPEPYNYKDVCRWGRAEQLAHKGQASASVLDVDHIFFPVHLREIRHWTAAVVSFKEKRFTYLDSLKGKRSDVLAALRRWVEDEHQEQKCDPPDFTEWRNTYPSNILEQHNSQDCGVFIAAYAELLGRGAPLEGAFTQVDTLALRVKQTAEIFTGTLST
ncbi:hypothetical protein WJX72_010619 [[Myrmecia] bisecta]|uniref:Ubiquitin-like protease family profile domain-containing protein n=1 Tax=[Myrmecia] bisecta TaxID=41462 RepID=A0AAW1P3S9_9CHLO